MAVKMYFNKNKVRIDPLTEVMTNDEYRVMRLRGYYNWLLGSKNSRAVSI